MLCTHLHFDHVGWNTRLVDGKWVPTFPNARYLFGRREYEHWKMLKETHGYHDLNHMYDAVQPVVDAGLVDLIEPEPFDLPGAHAASHAGPHAGPRQHRDRVARQARDRHGRHDAQPDPARAPGRYRALRHGSGDGAPDASELIDDLANSDVFVIGSHFSDPTGGWIVRDENGCRLAQQPAEKK